jgi:diaminohydroxyphosphoribosylaminopyrimidine deaminase/5-amino-6-(5-phosphoribosylamino)uracil reductase
VGTTTALTDNPRLNNRLWTGKDPIRLVIDRTLKIPRNYHLWKGNTLFFTEVKDEHKETVQVDFQQPLLPQLMQHLHERSIQSVLVEGGANTLQQFISAGLWDEARIITGTIQFPDGLPAPVLQNALLTNETDLEGDRIMYYRKTS